MLARWTGVETTIAAVHTIEHRSLITVHHILQTLMEEAAVAAPYRHNHRQYLLNHQTHGIHDNARERPGDCCITVSTMLARRIAGAISSQTAKATASTQTGLTVVTVILANAISSDFIANIGCGYDEEHHRLTIGRIMVNIGRWDSVMGRYTSEGFSPLDQYLFLASDTGLTRCIDLEERLSDLVGNSKRVTLRLQRSWNDIRGWSREMHLEMEARQERTRLATQEARERQLAAEHRRRAIQASFEEQWARVRAEAMYFAAETQSVIYSSPSESESEQPPPTTVNMKLDGIDTGMVCQPCNAILTVIHPRFVNLVVSLAVEHDSQWCPIHHNRRCTKWPPSCPCCNFESDSQER